jgi:hypothetical protein
MPVLLLNRAEIGWEDNRAVDFLSDKTLDLEI